MSSETPGPLDLLGSEEVVCILHLPNRSNAHRGTCTIDPAGLRDDRGLLRRVSVWMSPNPGEHANNLLRVALISEARDVAA